MSAHQPMEPTQAVVLEIEQLRTRVDRLEGRLGGIPSTMLLSSSFLARAFAVLGHYLVAGLIIAAPFYIIALTVALIAGGFR